MLKSIVGFTFGLVVLANTSVVLAGADCPSVPREQWLSELDMQKKIVNDYGFVIYKFKIDDNCYEIYGAASKESDASQWEKIEVYFDPSNGDIVKKKMKD
ncbi:PepSY domain-containing protein [Thioflexithrix psekupsensis]|uniref:PepSY domain-containing protein n=1 Tax=Thioflexithrix psekupsensis TaxID=1570016 RepID=A0A251XAD3_9GAMM|nr:PepSY domain-containing protein [Thioflexithrix psekupsensis]OUD15392.1 hypothetical protein TPSD3_02365 [Thioflexithrix psekupsensis]